MELDNMDMKDIENYYTRKLNEEKIQSRLDELLLEESPAYYKLYINKDYFHCLDSYKWGYIIEMYNEVSFVYMKDDIIYKKEQII